MRAALSGTILVVLVCAWTAAAVDFPLPVASTGSPQEDTKAECTRNIKRCWFLSFLKPSEPICASDQRTYSGECHLCSRVLYEGFNVTKLYDGPCGTGTKARAQLVPSSSLDQARQQDGDKLPYEKKQETAWT